MDDVPDIAAATTPDIAAAKQQVRARLLAARRARTPDALAAARTAVSDAVVARATARGWRCVGAYEPLRTEPGSTGLLERLVALGVEVLVPVTLPDRDLDWRRWPAGGPTGVDTIGTADAVLVPALAVGADGQRLGRGGGSYDRALARCSPAAERIALVFDDEVVDAVPFAEWDVPVHAVMTPSGWTDLHAGGNTAVADDR